MLRESVKTKIKDLKRQNVIFGQIRDSVNICKKNMYMSLNQESFTVFINLLFIIPGILTNIKKESEEQKVDSSEGGSSSCDTMSFPGSGHDGADGLHYRVQGTFTR